MKSTLLIIDRGDFGENAQYSQDFDSICDQLGLMSKDPDKEIQTIAIRVTKRKVLW